MAELGPKRKRQPQSRWQRLAEFLLFVALMVPLMTGPLFLIAQLQGRLCPAETFATGTTQGGLQKYSLILAATALCFFFEYWIVYLIPALRKVIGRRFPHNRRPGFRRHLQSNLALIGFAMALPAVIVAAGSPYCLAPHEILSKPLPWAGMKRHAWADVARIETSCTGGYRARWDTAFVLMMTDGSTLDIIQSSPSLIAIYPQLTRALQSADFTFSSEHVSPRCGAPNARVLGLRP